MKKFSILALSATVAIAPAFAETTAYYNTPSVDTQTVVLPQTTVSTTTPQVDLSFAFDDVENLQTKEMTATEMQETEGAWVANAVGAGVGGLVGHFGYVGSVAASGQYNFGHHAASVVGGAGLGFVNPVSAAGRAIAISKGTQTAVNTAISIGSPTAGVLAGNKFKTLNIK